MNTLQRFACLLLLPSLILTGTPHAAAQASSSSAPVPQQILQAQTVFVSNAGADGYFNSYTAGPDRAYNDLYAAIQKSGKYRIVATPDLADLIFEIRARAPSATSSNGPNDVITTYQPELQLQILDPRTRTILWTLTSYVHGALGLKATQDRQFDQAAGILYDQLRQLTGETLNPAEAKAVRANPRASKAAKIIFFSALGSIAVASGYIIYHFAHQSQPTLPTLPACTYPNPQFCPVP